MEEIIGLSKIYKHYKVGLHIVKALQEELAKIILEFMKDFQV